MDALLALLRSIWNFLTRLARRIKWWIQRALGGRGADVALLTGIVFAGLLYALPGVAWLKAHPLLFPNSTPGWRFLTSCVVVYVALFAVVLILGRWGGEPIERAVAAVARKTGLHVTDSGGLILAGLVMLFALARVHDLVPLGGAGLAAFGLLWFRPEETRPVGSDRAPAMPAGVPGAGLEPTGGSIVQRAFAWKLPRPGSTPLSFTLTVGVDEHRYMALREDNPYRTGARSAQGDYQRFVVGGITSEVLDVAQQFIVMTKANEFSTFLEVSNILAFVQSIPYSTDEESTGFPEYFRYPLETLADGTGDCDDSSILAAAILLALGHRVCLLEIAPYLDRPGHVAVGVAASAGIPGHFFRRNGQMWYYCETTETGWHVGEMPPTVRGDDVRVILLPQPLSGVGAHA